jgi:hypothetical protein
VNFACQSLLAFAYQTLTLFSSISSFPYITDQAYEWTQGKVIFASGSPFQDVVDEEGNVLLHPSQANNM